MRLILFACLTCLASCQPAAPPQTTTTSNTQALPPRGEPCRDDIPDCSAVCALRETGRTAHIDFFERRCAAVILGKNPDKVVTDLEPTPYYDAGLAPEPTAAATTTSLPPNTAFDPTSVGRTGTGEPPECKASRLLRAQKRDREADVLAALCAAKGGDAGF